MPNSSVVNSDFSFGVAEKVSKGYPNLNKSCKFISVSAYIEKYGGTYASIYRSAMEHKACPLFLQGKHLVPIIPVGLHLTVFRKERKAEQVPTPPKGFVSVLEYLELSNLTKYALYQKVHRKQVKYMRIGKYLFIKRGEE